MSLPVLNLDSVKHEARTFLIRLAKTPIRELYGVNDGKAIGTYVEHKFHAHLTKKFKYARGSSATGIDFQALEV